MIKKKIAIIGVGHIGQALAYGLLRSKIITYGNLTLANPSLNKLKDLQKKFKVKITSSNRQAARDADLIIIAVKPNIVKDVVSEIKPFLLKDSLIISVAASVTIDFLERCFQPQKRKILRIMPNLPVAYGLGVIGLTANKHVRDKDKKLLERLFSPLGLLVWCNNDEGLNRLSMISGSGPAYVAYFMNLLEKIAVKYGFSKKDAAAIVGHTFVGTLYHLATANIKTEDLVNTVATKGGITEEVIKNLEFKNFQKIFKDGIKKGKEKISMLTKELERR